MNASASCSLALLLAVVTQALAGTGWGTVLLVFAAYAAGSSVLLLTLSVLLVVGIPIGTILQWIQPRRAVARETQELVRCVLS